MCTWWLRYTDVEVVEPSEKLDGAWRSNPGRWHEGDRRFGSFSSKPANYLVLEDLAIWFKTALARRQWFVQNQG